MADQDLLAKFYNIDNLVTIKIEIPEVDWTKVATANAHFGWRGDAHAPWMPNPTKRADIDKWQGHRYDWSNATSVTVTGSKLPLGTPKKFNIVGIIKKSFGGSEDKVKPSFKLEFGRLSKTAKESGDEAAKKAAKKEKAEAIALFGTSGLTLNNCKQDASFVRQPLGYEIFRQGGAPYFRCNFAKVVITTPGGGKTLQQGVWVNVEQPREPFLQRVFRNDQGNLYETEAWFDLDRESMKITFDLSSFSDPKIENQKDIELAIATFDKPFAEAKKILDIEQISRVLAMQALVKHLDGYPNNTFVYNDVKPVENPTVENIKLRIVPSGIDAIFIPGRNFRVKNEGILSQLIIGDKASRERLREICKESAATFEKNFAGNVKFLERLKDTLKAAGAWNEGLAAEVKVVEDELQKVKAGMANVII